MAEIKVFKLLFEVHVNDVDQDGCSTTKWITPYENIYASRKAAVKQAQSKVSLRHINDYTIAAHAEVRACIVSDKGMTRDKRVYNLYKDKN